MKFSTNNNYKFKIFNMNLFGEEKKNILSKTKIVIHFHSIKNISTIPWAKICELILYKKFFLFERNNLHCFENNALSAGFIDLRPISFYSINDLYEKINYFINNKNEQNKIIENIHTKFIYYFNSNVLFKNMLKFDIENKKYNKNKLIFNKIIVFNFTDFPKVSSTYHNNQKNYICNILIKKFKKELLSININKNNCVKIFNEYINNNNLFLFNNLDIYLIFNVYLKLKVNNYELFNRFFYNINYLFIHYEVLVNTELSQIGMDTIFTINSYIVGKKRNKIMKKFYENAKFIITSIYKNIYYIKKINRNVIYYPQVSYSEYNKNICIKNKNKDIDIVFYGYLENAGKEIMNIEEII